MINHLSLSVTIEQFTDVYHVAFEKIYCARRAKKFMDAKTFYGGKKIRKHCSIYWGLGMAGHILAVALANLCFYTVFCHFNSEFCTFFDFSFQGFCIYPMHQSMKTLMKSEKNSNYGSQKLNLEFEKTVNF